MANGSKFEPSADLLRDSKYVSNVTQVFITTTEDKVKIAITEFKEAYQYRIIWSAPLGLVVSLLGTLVTATFAEKFGKPAAFWEAIFQVLFGLSTVALVVSIIFVCCKWRKGSDKNFIGALHGPKPASPGFVQKLWGPCWSRIKKKFDLSEPPV